MCKQIKNVENNGKSKKLIKWESVGKIMKKGEKYQNKTKEVKEKRKRKRNS